MIDWRDELRELLVGHRYESLSGRGMRSLLPHHIEALMNDLVPFIEDHFDPDERAETPEGGQG